MKAIVVYESHWGNTAAIARAIAEGLGTAARVLSTANATADAIADVELLVAGSPLIGFALPTETMLKSIANDAAYNSRPPNLSHPSMRTWLEHLPTGKGHVATFETRIWWSPGSAAKAILQHLAMLGYAPIDKPQRFIVKDKYGPLRDGELDRARSWGAELARKSVSVPIAASLA
jgi:hypothetical protein